MTDTARSTRPAIGAYLDRVGSIALLTAAEEVALARAIEAGRTAAEALASGAAFDVDAREELTRVVRAGKDARSHMVNANLRLVVSLARRGDEHAVPLLDLIQEGNLGLLRAVDKFDHRRGTKFSTYATWWIRQSINEALDRQRMVRLPPKVYRQLAVCRRAQRDLQARLGRPPTTAEVAAETEIDADRVRRLFQCDAAPSSIDDPGPERDALAGMAGHDGPAAVIDRVDDQELTESVDQLPRLECAVIRMRYGLDEATQTREQTADRLGISVPMVRHLEQRALRRLRMRARIRRLGADLPPTRCERRA